MQLMLMKVPGDQIRLSSLTSRMLHIIHPLRPCSSIVPALASKAVSAGFVGNLR